MDKILKLAKRLRHPTRGCPWDLKQDIRSVRNHTASEAREVRDAILKGNMKNLCEELGDVLWNVCFLITLAEEKRLFTAGDVRRGILKKMVHRHPHVFGKRKAKDAAEALKIFNDMKRRTGAKDGGGRRGPRRRSRMPRRA